MKKYILILIVSFVFSGNADHLIFNRVCILPDQAEMIEIYNPLSEPVDLTNYYLSDSNKYFEWINDESLGNFDFLINFPDGTIIQSGDTYVITTQEEDVFYEYYGYNADFSIVDEVNQNSDIGEYVFEPKLSSEEMLVLFFWDGESQTIQDVDYFLWGDYDNGVFKSTTDGYLFNDTILENQKFIRTYGSNNNIDSVYVRVCNSEIDELQFDGNGISGHDETSEDLVSTWMIQGIEKVFTFQDIIDGKYDCQGDSRDACPIEESPLDCDIIDIEGVVVDYFDITVFGGPHALTIEDPQGYRLELTIWPDTWDIANDPEYSFLLDPPYNKFLVKSRGSVFEYQGEKQILVCEDNLEILGNFSDQDGLFEDFEDINGNLIQDNDTTIVFEPFIDLNGDYEWNNNYPFCSFCFNEIDTLCIDYQISQLDCEDQGICSRSDNFTEEECADECGDWIYGEWYYSEPYSDLNENGQWDSGIEQNYNFVKALINPAPYVLIPAASEVLDFSYSFPSNSRVIIRVFDISGRFITTLIDKYYQSSGVVSNEEFYSSWDGTNSMGQILPPGTYLMHIEASNFQTGKTTTDVAPVVIGINK